MAIASLTQNNHTYVEFCPYLTTKASLTIDQQKGLGAWEGVALFAFTNR